MTRINILKTLLLLVLICASSAYAQPEKQYPTRPVTLVSPYPPGGGNDAVSRAIAQRLSISLGQTVLVENRAGANGLIAAEHVARAAPDGYTLLMGNNGTHGVNPSLYKKLPYDPLGDFAPVSQVGTAPNVLVVNPSLGVHSVGELVAYLKKHPGKATYGSTGMGSSQHMAGALFGNAFGVDMVHVPYKGSAPVLTDLLGGRIDMSFINIIAARPYIESGQLTALAVTSATRSQLMPDLPTIGETAKGYAVTVWIGIMAPRQTPKAIVDLLSTRIRTALEQPEMKAQLSAIGADPKGSSPDEFEAFIKAELKHGAEAVRISGATAE